MTVVVEDFSAQVLPEVAGMAAPASSPRGLSEEDVRAMQRRDAQRRARLTVD